MAIIGSLLLLAMAPQPSRLDFQLMTSPAYQTLAQRADVSCPARKLRYLHPADLDGIEEDFLPTLSRHEQHRIASMTRRSKACPPAGASCPGQHTLAAIARTGKLESFVNFACASTI